MGWVFMSASGYSNQQFTTDIQLEAEHHHTSGSWVVVMTSHDQSQLSATTSYQLTISLIHIG